jgi:hypothetical protein
LAIGLFISFALPQVANRFADEVDYTWGGWALVVVTAGVFMFVFLVGWGASKLRRGPEEEVEDLEVEEEVEEQSKSFYFPPIDFLLDVFDYNIDEDRLLGQQENFTWPLIESVTGGISKKAGEFLDMLGFVKGNFDGGLGTAMDDFRSDEEEDDEEEEKLDDEEKASESVKEKSKVSEEHEERSDKYRKHPHNVTATQF